MHLARARATGGEVIDSMTRGHFMGEPHVIC